MTITETILPPDQAADLRSILDRKLIRAGLLMLVFMTTAFGAATWNAMQGLSSQLKLVPAVLFVIVCILVARLYTKLDEIAAVQQTATRVIQPVAAPNIGHSQLSVEEMENTKPAKVPLETRKEIWKYWDTNGTSRASIEHVRNTFGVSDQLVQHLLERYDVRWRKQLALLYWDNPLNEYMAFSGIDENQIAEDALRLRAGLPIYPVAGVWLCSNCRKRPCHCASSQG